MPDRPSTMNCKEVREELVYYLRGQLAPKETERVATHVQGCAACFRAVAAERELSELLEHRLERHAAPLALKRNLADLLPREVEPAAVPRRRQGWLPRLVPPLASAVAAAMLTVVGLRALHPQRPESQ